MTTKTIKIPSVLVVADEDKHVFDKKTGDILKLATIEHAPMTPVTLDTDEADRLLALFGERAEEVGTAAADVKSKAPPPKVPPSKDLLPKDLPPRDPDV